MWADATKVAAKLAVPVTLVWALTACAPGADAPEPSTEPEAAGCLPTPIEVEITYELVTDASGGVTIEAASNLPDGALMNASFFVEGGYFGQDEATLENGQVSFGPFSDKGTPLKGTYEMSITLPIARNQPESVQACIGSAGEELAGPLVSAEEITGDNVASLDETVSLD